jgi:hypothetical protein
MILKKYVNQDQSAVEGGGVLFYLPAERAGVGGGVGAGEGAGGPGVAGGPEEKEEEYCLSAF